MRITIFLSLAVFMLSAVSFAAEKPAPGEAMLLWPDGAPGAQGEEAKDRPTLIAYIAEGENATDTAVVVCPGGGYGHLAMGHEGHDIAKHFNAQGVSAFIVDYRHRGKGYGHPAPLDDAQRAIRTVRANADAWGIDPAKIGVMGFSAGGHLASTAATHFDAGDENADDPIQRVSCRPDFAILCYAVIAFDEPYTHRGSQRNLLGEDASPELVRQFSNEKQVTPETPPTFLWHTDEDTVVPSENSAMFYLACKKNGVPAELHIYRKGRHGLGLAANIEGANEWPTQLKKWMQAIDMLP